jgi:hypothetical protein
MNFIVTDPQGNMYEVTGLMKFAIEHDLNFEGLRKVATGHSLSHKGWKAEYMDPVKKLKAVEIAKNKLEKRGWVIFTPEGRKLLTMNLLRFCRKHNLQYYNLRQSAITGEGYKGYRCFYTSKKKRRYYKKMNSKWLIIDPEGVEITVHNLKAFCRDNNLDYMKLWTTKNNKKPYAGWLCRKKR